MMTNTANTANRRYAAISKSKAVGILPVTASNLKGETVRSGTRGSISPMRWVVLFVLILVFSYFVLDRVYHSVIDFKHRVHIETEKRLESVYNFSSKLRQHRERLQGSLAKFSQDIQNAAKGRPHRDDNASSSAPSTSRKDSAFLVGQPSVLVSAGAVVTSSVRGNLGPSTVIVNGRTKDWLTDRWQAAKDMSGTPIPGEHFVMLHFARPVETLDKITLDWETAMATEFVVEVANGNSWSTLYSNDGFYGETTYHMSPHFRCTASRRPNPPKQHVIDDITCSKIIPGDKSEQVNKLRVKMVSGTKWGVSLWEVDVFGQFYQL